MKEAIDFSQPFEEVFGGGGSFFEPGLYRVERSCFGYYDFKKGKGNESLCLIQDLQPVDDNHKDNGEVVSRYFSVGGKGRDGTIYVEPCNPVKGVKGAWCSIRFTDADKHGKLVKTSEFAILLEYCHKNQVDLDSIGNDWTNAQGQVFEYGTVDLKKTSKKSAVEEAEEGEDKSKANDNGMKTYVIIVSQPKAKGKGTGSKATTKGKAEPEEKAEKGKSAAKGKAKGPEAVVAEYIEEFVKPDVESSETADWMSHKIELSKWLKKEKEFDADTVKAHMKVFNDTEDALPALLDTLGLAFDADEKVIKAA